MRFALGIIALWGGLTAVSEFAPAEKLAVSLAWATAVAMTFTNGEKALSEIQTALTSKRGIG